MDETGKRVKAKKVMTENGRVGVMKVVDDGNLFDDFTAKMESFGKKINPDPGKAKKVIGKMRKVLESSGEEGKQLARRIITGDMEKVDGYVDLIKKASSDIQTLRASSQALRRADELLDKGISKNHLRFEHDTGNFDIDLGVKDPTNPERYLEAYQFKTNTASLKSDALYKAANQLKLAPSKIKIIEMRLASSDNISLIQQNEKLNDALYTLLEKNKTTPLEHPVINEFHLLLDNGDKYKVISQDKHIKFIKF